MKQEDKQLLLVDLCARLPYHVRLKVWLKDGTTEDGFLDLEHNYADVLRDAFYYDEIKDIKPYLRPLSSMTEEEKEQMRDLWVDADTKTHATRLIDFYNKHHFDYRGLIPKGLAVEVTEENNPYKTLKT